MCVNKNVFTYVHIFVYIRIYVASNYMYIYVCVKQFTNKSGKHRKSLGHLENI